MLSLNLALFVSIDRRYIVVRREPLPGCVHGAALFAGISDFTLLTAPLAAELGRQRGGDGAGSYQPHLYPIISQLHAYRGSVIDFADHSITL